MGLTSSSIDDITKDTSLVNVYSKENELRIFEGEVKEEEQKLIIQNKPRYGNFNVYEEITKKKIFKLKSKFYKIRGKRTLYDVNGKKIAYFKISRRGMFLFDRTKKAKVFFQPTFDATVGRIITHVWLLDDNQYSNKKLNERDIDELVQKKSDFVSTSDYHGKNIKVRRTVDFDNCAVAIYHANKSSSCELIVAPHLDLSLMILIILVVDIAAELRDLLRIQSSSSCSISSSSSSFTTLNSSNNSVNLSTALPLVLAS